MCSAGPRPATGWAPTPSAGTCSAGCCTASTPSLANTLIALIVFLSSASRWGSSPATAADGSTTSSAGPSNSCCPSRRSSSFWSSLAVFSASPTAAMVTLGVLAAPGLARVVRGATLVVREELFVTAAVVSGVRPLRIMTSHVIRRVTGPILVQASVFAGIALAFQAAMAFLGLLSAGDRPTWGGMIADGIPGHHHHRMVDYPAGVGCRLHRAGLRPAGRRGA